MTLLFHLDDYKCEDTLDKYSKDLKNVNCTNIVNSDYCGNKYYGKWCCKSCAIALGCKVTGKQLIGKFINVVSLVRKTQLITKSA